MKGKYLATIQRKIGHARYMAEHAKTESESKVWEDTLLMLTDLYQTAAVKERQFDDMIEYYNHIISGIESRQAMLDVKVF